MTSPCFGQIEGIKAALVAFIKRVGDPAASLEQLELNLRLPASEWGTLRGSQEGAQLWQSAEGTSLIEAFMACPEIAALYKPPPPSAVVELQGRLAAFVVLAMRSGDPVAFVDARAPQLIVELTAEKCVALGIWLVRGLKVQDTVSITEHIKVAPATDEALLHLGNAIPGGAVAVPKDATAVITCLGSAKRDQWGPYAGGWAVGATLLVLHQLSRAIWLVTGVFPVPVVMQYSELAEFRSGRGSPEPMSFVERGRDFDSGDFTVDDAQPTRSMLARLWGSPWKEPEGPWDEETRVALDSALRLIDAAFGSPDGLLVNLACYAAIDGLLSARKDDDAVTVRRAAQILGTDAKQQRIARRRLGRLYSLRGEMAHGRRPELQEIEQALEIPADNTGTPPELRFPRADDSLRLASLRMARTVLAFFLAATIDVDDSATDAQIPERLSPGRSVSELRSLLDAAANGDATARAEIEQITPPWLRPARVPPPGGTRLAADDPTG